MKGCDVGAQGTGRPRFLLRNIYIKFGAFSCSQYDSKAVSTNLFRHSNPDFLDFFEQPTVKVAVPLQVRRPQAAAAYFGLVTAGFLPLLGASGAPACRIESVPGMATGTRPLVGGSWLPVAFRASDFYLSHCS